MDEPEIGEEEAGFVSAYIATGNMEMAARGTLVPVDASSAYAKKTAMQALGDTAVKAYFIDLMEEAQLTPLDMMKTLKRNLTTKKYALHQISGEKVEIGDDGMTQLTSAKLIMQAMGVLGGGQKVEPNDQRDAPTTINIVFPERNIHDSRPRERDYIDGDDDYSVTED